ncbi:MAG: hypothetical protein ACLUCE_01405 [Streptococcus sp.]|uniref:hypothetical protein n=1 Tax=Streptococcus sp. TaxID=1306 RepID=UPI0039924C4B
MKKVLLTSAAVLALFAAAAPAVADINGGANTPGAYDNQQSGGAMMIQLQQSLQMLVK